MKNIKTYLNTFPWFMVY